MVRVGVRDEDDVDLAQLRGGGEWPVTLQRSKPRTEERVGQDARRWEVEQDRGVADEAQVEPSGRHGDRVGTSRRRRRAGRPADRDLTESGRMTQQRRDAAEHGSGARLDEVLHRVVVGQVHPLGAELQRRPLHDLPGGGRR